MVGKIIFLVLVPIIACFCLFTSLAVPWNEEVVEYSTPPETTSQYIPEPYYISAPQQYGVDALQEYLQQWEWGRDYEFGVFDCTEMSALLERVLENKGFHTYIVVGQCDNGFHAWVKVEIVSGKYIIVEATTFTIVTEYNKYRETQQFETIYDALKVSQSSFDWWN